MMDKSLYCVKVVLPRQTENGCRIGHVRRKRNDKFPGDIQGSREKEFGGCQLQFPDTEFLADYPVVREVAVFVVSKHGTAEGGEMNTNLVGSAGSKLGLDERIGTRRRNHTVSGFRRFTVTSLAHRNCYETFRLLWCLIAESRILFTDIPGTD